MKRCLKGLIGLWFAVGVTVGCAQDDPAAQPAAPLTGPLATIPWQTLAQALPMAAPGWAVEGQVRGESATMMGIAVSTASVELVAANLRGRVDIVDTTMNPLIAMPFRMARAVQADSAKERLGPVMFGVVPATQRLNKVDGTAEVIAMVGDRIMVTVRVTNAGTEQPAVALAQMVNYAHLTASLPR